jgi:hypothetical protein
MVKRKNIYIINWFKDQYYIVQLNADHNKWMIISTGETSRDLLRRHTCIHNECDHINWYLN